MAGPAPDHRPREVSTLIVARHGETSWSATGRHTGTTDVALTEAGVVAAAALGSRLIGFDPVLVLSSPLARATATADGAGFAGRYELEGDLSEWDYGAYEGRTTPEIQVDVPGWSIWTGAVPGGESIDAVALRADRVIERVLAVRGPVLCFAHGHVGRIIAARWMQLPPTAGAHIGFDTARFGVLGHERATRVLSRWNV